jgi:phytoene synthase
VALYTLDHEWRRVASVVTTALAGEIRLAWWSEALERFAAGAPAEHPALAALGAGAVQALMPWLQATIEARSAALEVEGPCDAAETAIMTAAARLLSPDAPAAALHGAASAWAAAHTGRRAETSDRLRRVAKDLRRLPVRAFPAVAHATLARAYAEGRRVGDLEKRLRLAWAVLRGRL